MAETHEYFGLLDREQDIETLKELITITSIGVQAVSQMYDDHRRDTKVRERLFFMQENVVYRISAVMTQYELLIDGIKRKAVLDLKIDPFCGPFEMHPTVYKYSCELSSMVDNVFFHLCSAFDYTGHFVSYILTEGKEKTKDWDSLANTARGKWKDAYQTSLLLRQIDANLRKKLDEYRSELIHRNRDNHMVGAYKEAGTELMHLKYTASQDTMKKFRKLMPGYKTVVPAYREEAKYTMDFLCSMIFYQSLHYINALFLGLRADLINDSKFRENIESPKMDSPHPFSEDHKTGAIFPNSEYIWAEYQDQYNSFLLELNSRWAKAKPEVPDI